MATHRPTGAAKATVWVTSGGAATRRRSSGAATPAATTPQAVALMALDSRTAGVYAVWLDGPASAAPWPAAGRGALAGRRRGRGPCARAGGGRLGNERGHERARVVGLGVPLHAEREPPVRQLDRLGQRRTWTSR